mgnify:CR=1 FL=1
MKKYIVAAGLFLLMNSCLNNDFMEVYPKDQQTELTSFRSYENFKTYSWGLYNVFFGYAYKYNPQNEMFRLLGTKRSFSQNETFFFSHP